MEEKNLHHSGVLGMKWGVRRARRYEVYGKTMSRVSSFVGGPNKVSKGFESFSKKKGAQAEEQQKKLNAALKERFKKNLAGARKERKQVGDLIDSLVKEGADHAASRGKKFDKGKDRTYWQKFFKDSKVSEIRKRRDRLTKVQGLVENLLVEVGNILLS